MAKKPSKNRLFIPFGIILLLVLGVIGYLKFSQPNMENFKAPGKDWNSPKKVENYFVEKLR